MTEPYKSFLSSGLELSYEEAERVRAKHTQDQGSKTAIEKEIWRRKSLHRIGDADSSRIYPIDLKLAEVMLPKEDTFTARMLRELCEARSMSQADFMKKYHLVCARENEGHSSFVDNFGRFDTLMCDLRAMRTEQRRTFGCIRRTHVYALSGLQTERRMLHWEGDSPEKCIGWLTIRGLDHAENMLERATLEADNPADGAHALLWLRRVRAHMATVLK